MVAYAPTDEAPEGQRVKYMAALNSTSASVLAQEYIFILTDANARTRKINGGSKETDIVVLSSCGRDVLKESTARFCRRQEARSSEHFFFAPSKVVCPTRSKAPTAVRDKHVWTLS